MNFTISPEEHEKINNWLEEVVFPAWVTVQQKNPDIAKFLIADKNGKIHPYLGAIGGGLTYKFTPTSIGMVVKVSHPMIDGGEAELDITDYDSW